ncbi:hypothetical protein BO443_30027 [Burkholderia orbicola]
MRRPIRIHARCSRRRCWLRCAARKREPMIDVYRAQRGRAPVLRDEQRRSRQPRDRRDVFAGHRSQHRARRGEQPVEAGRGGCRSRSCSRARRVQGGQHVPDARHADVDRRHARFRAARPVEALSSDGTLSASSSVAYAGKAVLHRQVEFAQYASLGCRNLAAEFGMTVSMSRRANAWGNVRMESSFKTLKVGARHFYLAEGGRRNSWTGLCRQPETLPVLNRTE